MRSKLYDLSRRWPLAYAHLCLLLLPVAAGKRRRAARRQQVIESSDSEEGSDSRSEADEEQSGSDSEGSVSADEAGGCWLASLIITHRDYCVAGDMLLPEWVGPLPWLLSSKHSTAAWHAVGLATATLSATLSRFPHGALQLIKAALHCCLHHCRPPQH